MAHRIHFFIVHIFILLHFLRNQRHSICSKTKGIIFSQLLQRFRIIASPLITPSICSKTRSTSGMICVCTDILYSWEHSRINPDSLPELDTGASGQIPQHTIPAAENGGTRQRYFQCNNHIKAVYMHRLWKIFSFHLQQLLIHPFLNIFLCRHRPSSPEANGTVNRRKEMSLWEYSMGLWNGSPNRS